MGTREDLVAAATELLDTGGAEAVTLREVGHRAGVSHNAPYRHFTDKEALLAAIATDELAGLADTMRRHSATAAGPRAALRAVVSDYVSWALAYPARFTLVFGTWTTDSPELGRQATNTWELMVAAVTEAQAASELPAGDPERLAALIRATAHGAIGLTLAGHLASDGKGHADAGTLVDDLFGHL